MAAAAVLRIGRWLKGDRRGVEGGNGTKGRGAERPVEFHFDRPQRGPAEPGFNPLEIRIRRRVTGCHAQKSFPPAILSVNGRHRPRDIESRTNMSTRIERGNR